MGKSQSGGFKMNDYGVALCTCALCFAVEKQKYILFPLKWPENFYCPREARTLDLPMNLFNSRTL